MELASGSTVAALGSVCGIWSKLKHWDVAFAAKVNFRESQVSISQCIVGGTHQLDLSHINLCSYKCEHAHLRWGKWRASTVIVVVVSIKQNKHDYHSVPSDLGVVVLRVWTSYYIQMSLWLQVQITLGKNRSVELQRHHRTLKKGF